MQSIPTQLNQIRKLYEKGLIGFDDIPLLVKNWRDDDKYLSFKVTDNKGNITYLYSKCSKRGNDIYRSRVQKKQKELLEFCENNDMILIDWDGGNVFYSNILKMTLTVNSKKVSRDVFNKRLCSYYVDLFAKRIRNKYSNVKIARTYEVSDNGFLHVNLVLIFPNHRFRVRYHKSKKKRNCKGKPVETWRLLDYQQKREFDNLWEPGFIDIRAIENTKDLIEYTLKYQIKYFTHKPSQKKQDLTLGILSFYNKRSFSIPKSFKIALYDIVNKKKGFDREILNRSTRLDIIKHNSLTFEFIGIFSKDDTPFVENKWYFETEKPPPGYEIDIKLQDWGVNLEDYTYFMQEVLN